MNNTGWNKLLALLLSVMMMLSMCAFAEPVIEEGEHVHEHETVVEETTVVEEERKTLSWDCLVSCDRHPWGVLELSVTFVHWNPAEG